MLLRKYFLSATILIAVFLIPFSTCFAAIAQIGSTVTAGGASGTITSSAIDTTGATLLVMTINDYSTSTASITPSDSKGNTWSKISNYGAASRSNTSIFYSYNKAGESLSVGSGHTFSISGGSYTAFTVSAWSGTATGTVNPLDQSNGASAASGTTLQPGSITPSANNELVISTYGSASTSTSVDSPFTLNGNLNYIAGVNLSNTMAYVIQTTAAAVNPTWTGNYNSGEASAIASFAPPSPVVVTEVTAVTTPGSDATPDYTFNSSSAGTITYGGDCSSITTSATSGDNTITFNTLAAGTHSNCTITVTDGGGSASNILSVSSFYIDILVFSDNFSSLVLGAIDGQNGWVKAGSVSNWRVESDGGSGKDIIDEGVESNYYASSVSQSSVSAKDSRISIDFKAGSANPYIWLRRTSTGSTSQGYAAFLYGSSNPLTLYIYYINGSGGGTQIGSTATYSPVADSWYTFEFFVNDDGSSNPVLQAWIYSQGTTRPSTPTLNVTDSSKLAPNAGYPGVSGSAPGMKLDNVKVYAELGATTTSLASSSSSSFLGQSVTFTATVTPSSATGTVTFKDGATTLGTASLSSGSASYSTSGLSRGSRSITAVYAGDSSNIGSVSSPVTQTVSTRVTISSPLRSVSGASNVATTSIERDECSTTFYIPYIQASTTLSVSATVIDGSLPSGGGVKFVMTDSDSNQTVLYDMSSPFSVTFSNLVKSEYTLDAYIVNSSQQVQAGDDYHDTATNIGIGDIFIAVGDSVTEGYNGTAYDVSSYTDWLSVPTASTDNRNYPQCGTSTGFSQDHWQEISHHIDLNNKLASFYGYPIFILNEGFAGITSSGYITRTGLSTWQDRINALQPNKWLVHLGINDRGTGVTESTFISNIDTLIDTFKTTYGAESGDIYLAVPSAPQTMVSWQSTISSIISDNSINTGPDLYTYLNNNPALYSGYHPNVAGHTQFARLWAISIISPQNVAVSQSDDSATLTWNSLSSIESTIAGYKIHYGTSSGNYTTTVDAGNVTSKTISGLTKGRTYYFAVSAYDNDSSSVNSTSNSSEVSIYILPPSGVIHINQCFIISASAGANGKIYPSGNTTVSYGSSQSYFIIPDQGYEIANLKIDNISYGKLASYSFSNIISSHTISVDFLPIATPVKNTTVSISAQSPNTQTNSPVVSTTKISPITQTLNYGSKGKQVADLQNILKQLKFFPKNIYSNGVFGPTTLKAVKDFQLKYKITKPGIYGYGIVGPLTRAALNSK